MKWIAETGDLDAIKRTLKNNKLEDTSILDDIVNISSIKGHFNIIKYILDNYTTINIKFSISNSIKNKHIEIAKFLITYKHKNLYNANEALDYIISYNDIDILTLFYENCFNDITMLEESILNSINCDIDIIKFLLYKYPNIHDNKALLVKIFWKYIKNEIQYELHEYILSLNIDINNDFYENLDDTFKYIRNLYHRTSICNEYIDFIINNINDDNLYILYKLSIKYKHNYIIEYLYEINNELYLDEDLLEYSLENSNVYIYKFICDKINITIDETLLKNFINNAIMCGNSAILNLLIGQLDLNTGFILDNNVIIAINNKYESILNLLIDNGYILTNYIINFYIEHNKIKALIFIIDYLNIDKNIFKDHLLDIINITYKNHIINISYIVYSLIYQYKESNINIDPYMIYLIEKSINRDDMVI